MEQSPHLVQEGALGTMRDRVMVFIEADMREEPEPLRPIEEMSVQELKLEADSMMALTTFLLTHGVGKNEAWQQSFADHLQMHKDPPENFLEAIKNHGQKFYASLIIGGFRRLQDQPNASPILERLEHYREGYYNRAPIPQVPFLKAQEANYMSSEQLLVAGTNTVTDRFPHLLHSLRGAALLAKLDTAEEKRLTYASGHLAALLAKLPLADLERFTDLMNEEEALHAIMVHVDLRDSGPVTYIDQRLFKVMKKAYPQPKLEYAHRRHHGCPASVSFDGEPSAISELWQLTVGALDRVGYWD